jgi:hypothetical protein
MSLLNFRAGNHPQQVAIRGAVDAIDDRETHPLYFDPINERLGPFTLDVAAAGYRRRGCDGTEKHRNSRRRYAR